MGVVKNLCMKFVEVFLVRYNIALDYYDSIQNKLIAVNNVFYYF